MKIKLCPQCGKQNDVNAWNCVDCGATLSMKTLTDTESLVSKQLELTYQQRLGSISPYFQNDVLDKFIKILRDDEIIVKGFDVCLSSSSTPFWFGYVVLTSERLISVYFEADTQFSILEGNIPLRSFIKTGTRQEKEIFINRLETLITPKELSSRSDIVLEIGDLSSIELVQDVVLKMKFRKSDGVSLVPYSMRFYFNDEAYEIFSLLEKSLKNH